MEGTVQAPLSFRVHYSSSWFVKTPVESHSRFSVCRRSSLSFPLYRYLIGPFLPALGNSPQVSSSRPRTNSRHLLLYSATLPQFLASVCHIILFLSRCISLQMILRTPRQIWTQSIAYCQNRVSWWLIAESMPTVFTGRESHWKLKVVLIASGHSSSISLQISIVFKNFDSSNPLSPNVPKFLNPPMAPRASRLSLTF